MFDHTQLQIWQRSSALSLVVDRALQKRAKRAPPDLVSQLSRSCSAIPAHIAEGSGCSSARQTAHYLDTAVMTLNETQSHLHRAGNLGVIPLSITLPSIEELTEIRRMIASFRRWVLRNED